MAIELEVQITRDVVIDEVIEASLSVLNELLALPADSLVTRATLAGLKLPRRDSDRSPSAGRSLQPGLDLLVSAGEDATIRIYVMSVIGAPDTEEGGTWVTVDMGACRTATSFALMLATAIACGRTMSKPIVDEANLLKCGRHADPDAVFEKLRRGSAATNIAAAARDLSSKLGLSWVEDAERK